MPQKGTPKQEEIFDELTEYIGKKGYEYLGYNGSKDDNHIFGKIETDLVKRKVYCYIKFISIKARKRPPESLLVLVKRNESNKNLKGFIFSPRDFWGQGSMGTFVIPGDEKSKKLALQLINTIK